MTKRLQGFAEQGLLATVVFTIVLLIFQDRLVVPLWVQPLGRMHPLFLHFPLVILLLAVGLEAFRFRAASAANSIYRNFAHHLLLAGALSAGLTVIMGLLLSQEEGYAGDVLFWHKWTGVGIFLVATGLYWVRNKPWYSGRLAQFGALVTVVLLLGAGHFGATLTHGANFLLEPISRQQKPEPVALNQAVVFTDIIQPIFEQKCTSCHNPDKRKGELALTNEVSIRKGGKTGKLFVPGKPDISLLLERIHLPMDEKKHMPPSAKSQLSSQEIRLLSLWVKSRTPFQKKVIDLPPSDSLRLLAAALFKPADQTDVFDFDEADKETISALNTDYRTVAPVARESPALAVNLYNKAAFTPDKLAELSPLRQQIVSLNLNKMPVKDGDMKQITQFKNLQKLVLNFTDISGKALAELTSLVGLKTLSLSGTQVDYTHLAAALGQFKSLKTISLWNTPLTSGQVTQLQKAHKQIQFIGGFNGAQSEPIRLNPPQVKNGSTIFSQTLPLQIIHPVRGVQLRYTTDGSEPDSLGSPVLTPKTVISQATSVTVKAYKPGWFSSDPATFHFYKSSYKPDSVRLLLPLNPVHQAAGAHTFFDRKLGTFNANSPAWANNWAGFKKHDMVLLSEFRQPVRISSVSLRVMVEEETGIFPPGTVEVWGGPSWDQLTKLTTLTPDQPKLKSPHEMTAVTGTVKPQLVSCLKLVAKPLKQIPDWHPNKGKPALLLVDEVFIN